VAAAQRQFTATPLKVPLVSSVVAVTPPLVDRVFTDTPWPEAVTHSDVVAVLQAEAISAALIPDIDSGRFLGSGTMAALFAGRLRVVLNEVDLNSRLSRAAADAVARHLGPRLLGAVSRDETLAEALAMQKLVMEIAPESRAAEDIRAIARAIEAALPQAPEPFAGGWGAR